MRKKYKYNYFYKITNLINSHYYFGVHSTDNLEDGYMGSGMRLHQAYKKYGIENFKKDIIKYFDSSQEAYDYEAEIVNETLVKDVECYNIHKGGSGGLSGNATYIFTKKLVVKRKGESHFYVIPAEEYDPLIYDTTWTGKHHTNEGKNKRRLKQTPENSTNNRIWVTNMKGTVKYIRKELLDEFLSNGFELGRTGYKPRKNAQGKEIQI